MLNLSNISLPDISFFSPFQSSPSQPIIKALFNFEKKSTIEFFGSVFLQKKNKFTLLSPPRNVFKKDRDATKTQSRNKWRPRWRRSASYAISYAFHAKFLLVPPLTPSLSSQTPSNTKTWIIIMDHLEWVLVCSFEFNFCFVPHFYPISHGKKLTILNEKNTLSIPLLPIIPTHPLPATTPPYSFPIFFFLPVLYRFSKLMMRIMTLMKIEIINADAVKKRSILLLTPPLSCWLKFS